MFWSHVRLLSSAQSKGTGLSSSSGLYAPALATTVTSLCSESELYFKLPSGSGTGTSGRKNIGVLDMVLVLVVYSFHIYHAEIAVCNMIFSFLADHWNGKWHTHPFTIPSIPQVLHICFAINTESKWLILMPWFDLQIIAICLLHKVSDLCSTIRKNHTTIDITEPASIFLTLAILHSYWNTNVKLKREDNKSALTLETLH